MQHQSWRDHNWTQLNIACRAVTGCLKPTNVEDLYLLAGFVPILCVEKTKQETNEVHSLYGQHPAERRPRIGNVSCKDTTCECGLASENTTTWCNAPFFSTTSTIQQWNCVLVTRWWWLKKIDNILLPLPHSFTISSQTFIFKESDFLCFRLAHSIPY